MVRVRKNNMGWLKILFWLPQAQMHMVWLPGKNSRWSHHRSPEKDPQLCLSKNCCQYPLISVKKYPSKQKLLDLTLQNTQFLHRKSWKYPQVSLKTHRFVSTKTAGKIPRVSLKTRFLSPQKHKEMSPGLLKRQPLLSPQIIKKCLLTVLQKHPVSTPQSCWKWCYVSLKISSIVTQTVVRCLAGLLAVITPSPSPPLLCECWLTSI